MKNIVKIIPLCLLVIFTTSCSTQKITIKGKPNYEIYHPSDFKKLGTTDNEGIAKIKLSRDGYTPFLIAYDKETNNYHAFGIDFHYKKFGGLGIAITGILPPMSLIYGIASIGYTFSDQFIECFRYDKKQSISTHIPNAPYSNIGERKKIGGSGTKLLKNKKESSSNTGLLIKDYGKKLQGEYTVKGTLKSNNEVVETYSNLIIIIKRIDNKTVTVEIADNNQETILEPEKYIIKKNGNTFVLTSTNNSYSTLKIENDKIEYKNSNIIIDDVKYIITLKNGSDTK